MLTNLIKAPLTKVGLLSFSSRTVIVTLAVEESLLGIPSSVAITSNYGEKISINIQTNNFTAGTNFFVNVLIVSALLFKTFILTLTLYTSTSSLSSSPKRDNIPVVLPKKNGLFLIAVCPYVILELGFWTKIVQEGAVMSASLLASSAVHMLGIICKITI